MPDEIPIEATNADDHRRDAIFASYLTVCDTVRRALQTHLGAQHTLNAHRQTVIALQSSIQSVCN